MKKVIRLTESDLLKVIKRVIQEEEESDWWTEYGFNNEESFYENYENVNDYAHELTIEVLDEFEDLLISFFKQTDFLENIKEIVESRQKMFKERYPQYSNVGEFTNDDIDKLLTANANLDSEEIMDELVAQVSDSIFEAILSNKG